MERFSEESDIHSVKFFGLRSISPPRRFIWLLLFLAALGTFVWFSWLRITYFLIYPYTISTSTDTWLIPLPAIALCPSRLHLKLPDNASDVDFLIGLYIDKKAPFILIDSDTGEASIDVDEMKTRINTSLEDGFMLPTSLQGIDITRLQNITSIEYLRFPWKLSVSIFLQRHGVKRRRVSKWTMIRNFVSTSVLEYTREEMTSVGLCLVLDNINGTDLTFYSPRLLSVNAVRITGPNADGSDINGYIYDKRIGGVFATDAFTRLHFIYNNQEAEVTLNKVWHRTYLGKPYEEECVPGHKISCVESCVRDSVNCSTYFLNLSSSGRECDRFFLKRWSQEFHNCDDICPRSCIEQYVRSFTQYLPSPSNGSWGMTLKPEAVAEFESSVAQPLYTWDSLFAELGGTLGLFMGASLLALIHVFESFARWCCHYVNSLTCLGGAAK